jgi:hypothetical protein
MHKGAGVAQSVVSDYGLDDRAIGVRSPSGAKDFSSNLCVQTGSEAHPASCTMGTGGPFPGAKRGHHQLQFLLKLRVKHVYLFHVFLATIINRLNSNAVYAIEIITVITIIGLSYLPCQFRFARNLADFLNLKLMKAIASTREEIYGQWETKKRIQVHTCNAESSRTCQQVHTPLRARHHDELTIRYIVSSVTHFI